MLFFLRALGSISLVIAIVALAYDGTKSYSEGALSVTRLGQHWLNFSPATLNALQLRWSAICIRCCGTR